MKCLYIAQWNFTLGNGISNKIASQVDALNEVNPTDLCLIEDHKLSLNSQTIVYENSRLLGRFIKYKALYSIIKKNKYNFLYVRNITGFNALIFLIVSLLVKGKVKINIEIPTYPFSGEENQKAIINMIRKFVQYNYKYSVNSITYMGVAQDKIWGIPAIELDNGICVGKYKLVKKQKLTECLHIIGVGSLDYWHGYDRAIEGLAKSSQNIMLHIVGAGKELSNLQELSVKLGVAGQVVFHGVLHTHNLDDLFDKCHMAIDSLGRHRSGNNFNSSIKSKEYAARGLPFIQSHKDKAFYRTDFVLKVPSDEQPIDFNYIYYWYKQLDVLPVDIRKFALTNLQWNLQFDKLMKVVS